MDDLEKKFPSIFDSPDDLFKEAARQGIIELIFGESIIQPNGIIGTRIQIHILKPKNWVIYLNTIIKKTKNPTELQFVSNLLIEFNNALKENNQTVDDLENVKNEITEERIQKLKQINTIDDLLKSLEMGEL